jgi:hypothetical protein
MKQLIEAKNTDLFWEQPKAVQQKFILSSEKNAFAKLELDDAFSTFAEATSGDEHLSFEKVGLFSPHVIVQ